MTHSHVLRRLPAHALPLEAVTIVSAAVVALASSIPLTTMVNSDEIVAIKVSKGHKLMSKLSIVLCLVLAFSCAGF